jgi:hypothetical protein
MSKYMTGYTTFFYCYNNITMGAAKNVLLGILVIHNLTGSFWEERISWIIRQLIFSHLYMTENHF